MANIFREVDEDIRKERYINLFKKYGVYVVVIIVIIVGTLAGIQFYSNYQISKNEILFTEYINILEANREDSLEKLNNLNDSSNSFIKGMNLLKRTDLLISRGEIDTATLLLDQGIDSKFLNKIHHDVAIYKLLMINLEDLNIDEFKSYQDKLLSGSEILYLTEELIAIKYLIEDKKEDAIKKFNDLLKIKDIPIEVINRSSTFLNIANQ